MRQRGLPGRGVRARERGRGGAGPRRSPPRSSGRRARRPRAGRTPAGRPRGWRRPTARSPGPPGSPGRTARRGSAGRRRPRPRSSSATSACGTRPTSRTPARPSSSARSGPSPTTARLPAPLLREGLGEPHRVLALVERPDQDEERRLALPADAGRGPRRRPGRGSAPGRRRSRPPRSRPSSSGSRATSSCRRKSDTAITRAERTARRVALPKPGNAPMLRTSRPCAVTTSPAPASPRGHGGRAAGGEEEVRVHDVRAEAPREPHRLGGETHVLRPGTAPGHGVGELVPPPLELAREVCDEDAELRRPPGSGTSGRRGGSALLTFVSIPRTGE